MKKKRNSFRLLWQAILDSRQPMWASLQVLIILTLILATIFFIAESRVQPDEYNYGRSILWGFTRYIGDPGNFAGNGPVTLTGRIVASCIGIVGILIFAVPAGLIASGFRGAIDKELRKEHLADIGNRLHKAFRRKQDGETLYMCVPRYLPLGLLQAQKHMTEKDVIDAVDFNPPFRLRHIGAAGSSHPVDQLVVEMFPKNTLYGSCINRNSKITIVAPSAVNEAGMGNFAYYLALIGGFNYISKEIDPTPDEPSSYYIISNNNGSENLELYLSDLRKLSSSKDHWTIFLTISENKKDADIHFITKANPKTGIPKTILDQVGFEKLYDVISAALEERGIKCDLDEYRPVGPKNVSVRIGGGTTVNAFSIRIFYDILVWDNHTIALAKTFADSINETIGDPDKAASSEILKERGLEYQK